MSPCIIQRTVINVMNEGIWFMPPQGCFYSNKNAVIFLSLCIEIFLMHRCCVIEFKLVLCEREFKNHMK